MSSRFRRTQFVRGDPGRSERVAATATPTPAAREARNTWATSPCRRRRLGVTHGATHAPCRRSCAFWFCMDSFTWLASITRPTKAKWRDSSGACVGGWDSNRHERHGLFPRRNEPLRDPGAVRISRPHLSPNGTCRHRKVSRPSGDFRDGRRAAPEAGAAGRGARCFDPFAIGVGACNGRDGAGRFSLLPRADRRWRNCWSI